MHPSSMLAILAKEFPLLIRTEYHSQIEIGPRQYHDLWSKQGHNGLRVRFHGSNAEAKVYFDVQRLIIKLRQYDYKSSELAKLKELELLFSKVTIGDGIYCDAGFKDYRSKIAVIKVTEGSTDIHIRHSLAYSCVDEAESAAIKLAINSFPGTFPIYSDSKNAVSAMKELYSEEEGRDRITWIDRKKNKQADSLANLRNKH